MYIDFSGYLKSNASSQTDFNELQPDLHGSWICHLDPTYGIELVCVLGWEGGTNSKSLA